ncbi:VOC family protein [Candidatus Odyssella thessalonicensis]|uniref:VOC family protein n=1 Tax=Candidatus Odyssella thessalonicensis TaxID=84647 RepID=UPI000225C1B4|nr:VOC family protein [Candidatus Odyssella thessalonicensis]
MNKPLIKLLTLITVSLNCAAASQIQDLDYSNTKSHMALPVEDIEVAKNFYSQVFGVEAIANKAPNGKPVYAFQIGPMVLALNEVDHVPMSAANTILKNDTKALARAKSEHFIPCQHFGLFGLSSTTFSTLVDRLKAQEVEFVLEPTALNPGTPQQQLFTFVWDPQGYIIELRSSNFARGFQSQEYAQQAPDNIKAPADSEKRIEVIFDESLKLPDKGYTTVPPYRQLSP